MKVKFEHVFDVDLETFERLWNDPEVIDAVVKKLPNVKSRKVEEERKEGDKIYRKVLYEGEAEIPDAVKKMIKPDMLKWYEITTYYPSRHEYDFEMVPLFFDKIHFKGKVKLIPEGSKTRRIIEGELTIKLNPLVRKVVEGYMKRFMEENLARESKALEEEMKKRLKK